MAKVTLTFDNGPEPSVTHHVLDVMKRHDVKSTFFVVGRRFETPEGRKVIERAKDEGHWIGNHTYTHTISLGDAPGDSLFDEEVERTQKALGNLAHPDKLFRPFFNAGVNDERILKKSDVTRLVDGAYTCVLYNSLCGDWGDGRGWVYRALADIESQDWTTLILHDIEGYPDGYVTGAMSRFDEFLYSLKSRGHEVVQEFDPAMMPIQKGEIKLPIDSLCN